MKSQIRENIRFYYPNSFRSYPKVTLRNPPLKRFGLRAEAENCLPTEDGADNADWPSVLCLGSFLLPVLIEFIDYFFYRDRIVVWRRRAQEFQRVDDGESVGLYVPLRLGGHKNVYIR